MENPFDQFDQASQGNPFDQFDQELPKMRSVSEIRDEVKAERGDQSATFLEGIGRGQMDAIQGTAQLGANMLDTVSSIGKSLDTTLGKDTAGRKAAGILNALFIPAPLQMAAKMVPEGGADDFNNNLKSELSLFEENNPDFSFGRLGGNIANPLLFVPGSTAKTLGGRVLGGAVTGSGMALTQPVKNTDNFAAEKVKQGAVGTILGGTLPVATKALGSAKKWISGLVSEKGVYKDLAKFLQDNISENKDKIISAIQKSINDGDGKTVGQAIADVTKNSSDDFGGILVRLEQDLARGSDALKSIYASQSSARREIIDGIAGAEGQLEKAIADRASISAKNYAAAFEQKISDDSSLIGISNNKFFREAWASAQDLAQAKGINSKNNLTEVLHDVKLGLDGLLSKTADKTLDKAQRKAVAGIKDNLVSWLANKNPLYEQARSNFAAASGPINRMEVGQVLKDALTNSLAKESPSTFANAVRNAARTLKKSTGFSRFTKLEDVLPKGDVAKLNNITRELATENHAAKMARQSNPMLNDLAQDVTISLPRILSTPIVIANHQLKKLAEGRSPAYRKLLTEIVSDKAKFLKAYSLPQTDKQAQMAIDIVERLNTLAVTPTAAREIQ